jgi:hypothetical protein
MRIVQKSKRVMGSYVALHGRLPANEMPKRFKGKIPKNEVWVRSDKWNTEEKRIKLKTHEDVELRLMRSGVPYRQAHNVANKFEKQVHTKK